MARRRQPAPPKSSGPFPAELAMGPCIEVWAGRPNTVSSTAPWFLARRAWRDAVNEWAEKTGWAHAGRPADNACNLARTRYPWSRSWLLENGHQEYVDYFEGRTEQRPDIPQPWQPMHG